jgi:LmbE family N-acetylglucosaminyl deacetylase
MATLVMFHAHPDDEAIATGGTMARYAADGHRVVLVVATHGEEGEVAEGFLSEGESLATRRMDETHTAAALIGVSRVEFLGYRDSGMMGTPANDHPDCFWRADLDEAAARLAAILTEERADVLTVYDDHGGYGHPDHIQVHRVGHRAAVAAGVPRVFEATMNRDVIRLQWREAAAAGVETPGEDEDRQIEEMGTPDAGITTAIEVGDFLEIKRRAMAAHASQIDEASWFLSLPPDTFRAAFGTEWFVRTTPPPDGAGPEHRETSLLG